MSPRSSNQKAKARTRTTTPPPRINARTRPIIVRNAPARRRSTVMSLETTTETRTAAEFDDDAKAVLYLRVSSKRQMDTAVDIDPDGNSIATQREVSTRKANNLAAT